jgi:hypothetical protein
LGDRELKQVSILIVVALLISPSIVFSYFGVGNFEVPPPEAPPAGDTDGDGIPDWWEDRNWWRGTACMMNKSDPGDAALDFDGDLINNSEEYRLGLNPCLSNFDSDLDKIPDPWEEVHGLDKFSDDADLDPDGDGLSNYYEYLNGGDPTKPDTDSDGMPDGFEVEFGFIVWNSSDAMEDADSDEVNNLQEYLIGTDPRAEPFNVTMDVTMDISVYLDANMLSNATLNLTPSASLSNVTITVTRYVNVSKKTVNPPPNGIERGVEVNATKEFDKKIRWVIIRIYYAISELDTNGDGDADDPGDIDENTLKIYWYCFSCSTDNWKVLETGSNYSNIGGPYVFWSRLNTSGRFLEANISSFGLFGIGGSLIPEKVSVPPAAGGGGVPAPTTPPPIFKGGVISLTPQVLLEIIQNYKLNDKSFWTVPLSVAAALVLTGEYPTPMNPLVQGILVKPIKILLEPFRVFKGKRLESPKAVEDIYEFVTGKVLKKYQKADVVVISVREPPVDSLAAIAYAKSINAPILLVEHNELPDLTFNAVLALNPKKIIIVGGKVAISEEVEARLKNIAPTERIWGPTRYETAVELAKKLDPEVIVVTDGENPSIDAAIIAERYKAPILYVKKNEIPHAVRRYIVEHKKTKDGKEVTVITAGLEKAIEAEVQSLYSLPEFLTRSKLILKLYSLGSKAF